VSLISQLRNLWLRIVTAAVKESDLNSSSCCNLVNPPLTRHWISKAEWTTFRP